VTENSDFRRSIDAMIPRIDQKLDDLIKRFDEHLLCSGREKERINNNLEVLTKSIRLLSEKPFKALEWSVVVFFTGGLLWLGQKGFDWISRHWIR
jgi:hypothetical protein